VDPGVGLDRCGKSRLTGIRSPDLPAPSESLYRLRYPGSLTQRYFMLKLFAEVHLCLSGVIVSNSKDVPV
jgi:hypothetical protein